MFAGKKSAQIREILISESAWEEMTCLFAPSLEHISFHNKFKVIEAPFKIPSITIYMIYNRVNLDDPNFANFIDECEKNKIIE